MQTLSRAWRIAMLATAAVGAILLGAALLAGRGLRASGAAVAVGSAAYPLGTALAPARATPPLRLIDEHGRPTSLRAFAGRWLVLAPAMTLCREVCPMTTAVLMELASRLRRDGLARRVAVAEVTVDPWRDTPARLRAYRRLTGANFALLTGTAAEIRRVWKFFGVYYRRVPQGDPPDVDWWTHRPETFDVQHGDGVFILDPAGRERIVDEGMAEVAGTLPAPLRGLLDAEGREDLAHPRQPWTAAQVLGDLARLIGTPASLAQRPAAATRPARRRASRLLPGGFAALRRRLASLRGHPVVLNAWASWCPPCAAELPLFASASLDYAGQVAFVGADTDDGEGAGRSFLAQHPTGYPSYGTSAEALDALAPVTGTPTTLFLDAAGRVVHAHPGQYPSQAALDADIDRYALGA